MSDQYNKKPTSLTVGPDNIYTQTNMGYYKQIISVINWVLYLFSYNFIVPIIMSISA